MRSRALPPDEAAAYVLLEQLRWGAGPPTCPHCGVAGRSFALRRTRPGGRRTRAGTSSPRRVWKCGACRRQFSVLVGTALQGSRASLRAWITVAWACESRPRPSAAELARRCGATRASVRQMLRRIDLVAAGRGDVLSALLRLSPAEAERIRGMTPARVRPDPQRGPSADYGSG